MYDFGADAVGLGSDLRLESALFGLLYAGLSSDSAQPQPTRTHRNA